MEEEQDHNPTDNETYDHLMRFFGRHIVCLVVSFVYVKGKTTGQQKTFFYPGFIISFRGTWLIVTAGHSIQELDTALEQGVIHIEFCRLIDCLSPTAPHTDKESANFPFDYEGSTRLGAYFDRNHVIGPLDGRDFGLIIISDYDRKLLESNGISPLPESRWRPPDGTVLDGFVLVGIPEELIESEQQGTDSLFQAENVCIPVKKLDQLPDDAEPSTHERFVGRLRDDLPITSVEGMSGGPIIGIGDTPDEKCDYWVVAIQSTQLGRTIFGYPFDALAELIERAVAEHDERRSAEN